MNRSGYKIIGAALLSAILTTPGTAANLQVSTGEWPPYTSAELSNDGTVNNTIRLAFEKIGHSVEFKYLPWARALKVARDGKVPATSFCYYDAEREADFIYVGPVSTETTVFAAALHTRTRVGNTR